MPYLETFENYRQAIAAAGFELRQVEIVTPYNLDILNRDCVIIYYQVRKLRDEKSVVASGDILSACLRSETLSEQFITTGPFKATALAWQR